MSSAVSKCVSEDSELPVELTAGDLIVVAQTDAEVPDWGVLYREMNT